MSEYRVALYAVSVVAQRSCLKQDGWHAQTRPRLIVFTAPVEMPRKEVEKHVLSLLTEVEPDLSEQTWELTFDVIRIPPEYSEQVVASAH